MLEIRAGPTEPVLSLTWDEFERMVQRGQVAPTDLVRAQVITGDDWWTADDLAVFHRNSRTKHPYGQHLAAEIEAKNQRAHAEREARHAEIFYEWARRFEDAHRLTPLPLTVTEPGVALASRVITRPAFRLNRIVTCVYTESALRVEVVTSAIGDFPPQLRCSISGDGSWADCPTIDFPAGPTRRSSAVIDAGRAPEPFQSADALVAATKGAPPCMTMALDGVIHDHLVMTPTTLFYAYWSNPGEGHVAQLALIAAYEGLVEAAGLGDAGVTAGG